MGRLRGLIWLIAGLVVATMAGLVAFITLSRAAAQGSGEQVSKPMAPAVVAVRFVAVRSVLTTEDLQVRQMSVDTVPEGAVSEVVEAEGRITLTDLYPGEVILAQRVLDPNTISNDGRQALLIAEDEVLMAFPARDLMTKIGVLKAGDRVDLLVSLEFPVNYGLGVVSGPRKGESGSAAANQGDLLATFCILQNVGVAGIIGGQTNPDESDGKAASGAPGSEARSPEAILFPLSPQDALVLKYAKDAGGIQDVVLRAPGMARPFTTEPVDIGYVINRYQIPTESGQ